MKKLIVPSLMLVVFAAMVIVACNKNNYADNQLAPDTEKVEADKARLILQDANWIFIRTKNAEFIDNFINANINIASFDFNNSASFLKVVGKTKVEYEDEVSALKIASEKLKGDYSIAPAGSCASCNETVSEKIANLKKVLLNFKEDKAAFAAFKNGSIFDSSGPVNRKSFMSLMQCMQACYDAGFSIGGAGSGGTMDMGYCLNQCMNNW